MFRLYKVLEICGMIQRLVGRTLLERHETFQSFVKVAKDFFFFSNISKPSKTFWTVLNPSKGSWNFFALFKTFRIFVERFRNSDREMLKAFPIALRNFQGVPNLLKLSRVFQNVLESSNSFQNSLELSETFQSLVEAPTRFHILL